MNVETDALEAPAPLDPNRPIHVLIADDIDVNRELVRLMLEKKGYLVDEVQNGQGAMDAIIAGDYDLVLMDMQMPVMDGYRRRTRFAPLAGDSSTFR
jgi:CheY-like chemotaxis protein